MLIIKNKSCKKHTQKTHKKKQQKTTPLADFTLYIIMALPKCAIEKIIIIV
jgi:hypothetical protein